MASYLASKTVKCVSKSIQVYMRDILDHVATSIEKLEFVRESLNQTHSNYLTRVSMEIVKSAENTDTYVNRLTVLATMLT